jgi:DNA-binding MarR family transcriptional regulator
VLVHISWALIRVAKAFLEIPRHDVFDLAGETHVDLAVIDRLIPRMVREGWLTTEDGWIFQVTPAGQRALVTVLARAQAFSRDKAS